MAEAREYFHLRPEVEKAYGYTHAVRIGDDIKISGAVSMDDPGSPTAGALMDELKKVKRTVGQNAVQQATIFSAAMPVTGLVITKLDGTARGGVGEQAADLVPFDASTFARELLEQ